MSTEHIRLAIESLKERFIKFPEKAVGPDSPALARLANDLSVTVEAPSGYSVTTAMPKGLAGTGEAPTPGWFMRAGVASCTATAIAMRAAELSVPIQQVEVAVESLSNNAGGFDISDDIPAGPLETTMRITVASDVAPKEALEEIVRWAVEHSPVADALKRPIPLTVDVTVA
jgi:uncharacterized OsmC-like protein